MDAPYYPSLYIGHSSPHKVVGWLAGHANFRANKGKQALRRIFAGWPFGGRGWRRPTTGSMLIIWYVVR